MIRRYVAAIIFLSVLLSFSVCTITAAVEQDITVPIIEGMKEYEIPDNDALRFVRDMKTGWNLGNTFDAYGGNWFHGPEPQMETIWCQVRTSQDLIHAIRDAGFGSIRIPVSWHDHVDSDYNINPIWMNRVKEVAGWALDEGMYVIINVHHDNDPTYKYYFYPDSAHYEQSAAFLKAIWTQMAESFAEFGDHLILESMNEPRLIGTAYEWNFNEQNAQCRDAADCINRLNQLFVDTVRAAGGNNALRYLSCPGYSGGAPGVTSDLYVIPQDSADNRILVNCHAYTPYNFALNMGDGSYSEFDLNSGRDVKYQISTFMDQLYDKYVSKGIPVIIDEYGALNKNGNTQDRVNFMAYYVCAASVRGITCFLWDNHSFSGNGEQFGFIDRAACKWKYPEIVEAIMSNCLTHRQ